MAKEDRFDKLAEARRKRKGGLSAKGKIEGYAARQPKDGKVWEDGSYTTRDGWSYNPEKRRLEPPVYDVDPRKKFRPFGNPTPILPHRKGDSVMRDPVLRWRGSKRAWRNDQGEA